jgi:hypothetical protein
MSKVISNGSYPAGPKNAGYDQAIVIFKERKVRKMDKKIRTFFAGLVLVVFLTACQSTNSASINTGSGSSTMMPPIGTQMAPAQTQVAGGAVNQASSQVTETATAEVLATETVTSTVITVSETDDAVQAVKDYFSVLESQDFTSASKMISAHSLRISSMTSGDVLVELKKESANGTTWSDLEVTGSEIFDDNTVLVYVSYQLGSVDSTTQEIKQTQVDEIWAVRSEGSKWMINWENIIDVKSLDVTIQDQSGLTIKPTKMIRYTDKIRLVMLAQNTTGKDVYMGYSTQILATFYFGTESVDAVKVLTVLSNNQTYNDYAIDVAGLFDTYPDSVEIIKYVDYPQYAPWFTFTLTD